jgi:putative transposase
MNLLKRRNKERKRRAQVATLFPNEASLLRLITAVLTEYPDDWKRAEILDFHPVKSIPN